MISILINKGGFDLSAKLRLGKRQSTLAAAPRERLAEPGKGSRVRRLFGFVKMERRALVIWEVAPARNQYVAGN